MNYICLSPEQRRQVCEDLLFIEQAGRLADVWSLRRQMLREHRGASAWEMVEIDFLTKRAASLIGGSGGYWREAAAAALGIPSVADVTIEAVCQVADLARAEEREQQRREQQREQAERPRFRMDVGNRKRGTR